MSVLKSIYTAFFMLCITTCIAKVPFSIHIVDNAARYNNKIEYTITNDSVIVTGVGDFGRTPVSYIRRPLERKERRTIEKFLSTFPVDSLDDLYMHNYNPADYEGKNNYARITSVSIVVPGAARSYRVVNCYVRYSALIFDAVNPLLPQEVRLHYNKEDFSEFY